MNTDIMPVPAPLPNPTVDVDMNDGRTHHSSYDAGNGYSLSVISGWCTYTDVHHRYECVILQGGELVNEIGYCDAAKVQQLLDQLKEL